ncbi:MAG TPA: deoxyguanosinetriphosphate triphosphohydrolase [Thermomicrobiales bacterium]|nr:deoxyguanosinetriphosphate triphosphohydrolase [Thermomicrobiales bacterium]
MAPPVDLYAREELILAPLATRSIDARRQSPEELPDLRTPFQRDRDRIIHSKSFRRLMHKTQVFIGPSGDHVRTRLTHTLEVAQIARTIGRALGLNEDLIEAIGMGHDLGHTPFGHAGERALATLVPGFRHNEQSLRIVDNLEKDGRGLNLTEPVRDGILRHSKSRSSLTGEMAGTPATLEGQVLKIADGVAYLNHDLDDAIRAGEVQETEVPVSVLQVLGNRHSVRINTMVMDIVAASSAIDEPGQITMSLPVLEASNTLRNFLYAEVYEQINARPETLRVQGIVTTLFEHFRNHPDQIPDSVLRAAAADPLERQVTDYVASMTDRYAVELFERLAIPHYLAP